MVEQNVEAWRRYVSTKISELIKHETLKEPVFQKILEQVKEDKRRREEYEYYHLHEEYLASLKK